MRNIIKTVQTYLAYIVNIIFSAIFVIGCSGSNDDVKTISLELIQKLQVLPDSTYLSNVTQIVYGGEFYFMNDQKNARVVRLSKDLKASLSIGSRGHGPGEFSSVGALFIKDDLLYAASGAGYLNVFKLDGQYKDKWIYPGAMFDRFIIKDETLIFASMLYKKPILRVDIKGDIVHQFGEVLGEDEGRKFINNMRMIFQTSGGDIISVPHVNAPIERYSAEGELLEELNLESYPHFIEIYKNAEKNPGGMGNVHREVYLANERLYIAYGLAGVMGSILVIDVSGEKMVPLHVLRFTNEYKEGIESYVYPSSICVDDAGNMLMYDRSTSILYQYKM